MSFVPLESEAPKHDFLVPLRGGLAPSSMIVDKEAAMSAHKTLCGMERTIRSYQFDVAEQLWLIEKDQLYRKINGGYGSLGEYVHAEFGMSERRGKYLVEIWEYFGVRWRECPDMLARAREIGWSVVKELVGVVTPQNFREWFDMAETAGIRTLKSAKYAALNDQVSSGALSSMPRGMMESTTATVEDAQFVLQEPGESVADVVPDNPPKSKKKKPKMSEVSDILEKPLEVPTPERLDQAMKKTEDWVTKVFRFHADSITVVDEAIATAKEQSKGRINDSAFALDMICLSYLATVAEGDIDLQRDDILRAVERGLGVTLIAVDEKRGEIVYGDDSAQRLCQVADSGR